jgi:hypothetical protein
MRATLRNVFGRSEPAPAQIGLANQSSFGVQISALPASTLTGSNPSAKNASAMRCCSDRPGADIFTHPKNPITQTFLAEVLGDPVPVSLASRLQENPVSGGQAVIRVLVRGDAGDTLVARLARELSIDVALLSARIDEIGGQRVGSLTIGVPGGDATAPQVLAYLSQHRFSAERLGYVA